MVLVHLYRYPHPTIPNQWLYVGQGVNRDKQHRSGASSFGRRFRKLFPDTHLPEPVRWTEPASNYLEANEAETIAMFRYHTWRGYQGGMNLTLPGTKDYEHLGKIGGAVVGRITKENGTGLFRLTSEQLSQAGRKGGLIGIRNMPREAKVRGGKTSGPDNLKKMTKEAKIRGCYLGGKSSGSISGKRCKENGHLAKICHLGGLIRGPIQGRKNVESGLLSRICADGGRISGRKMAKVPGYMSGLGRISACLRWRIPRGRPCTCGKHLPPET